GHLPGDVRCQADGGVLWADYGVLFRDGGSGDDPPALSRTTRGAGGPPGGLDGQASSSGGSSLGNVSEGRAGNPRLKEPLAGPPWVMDCTLGRRSHPLAVPDWVCSET